MGGVRIPFISSLDPPRSSEHDSSHIEGPSAALGTSLNYCAIRILGMSADHPVAVKARGCLHKMGRSMTRLSFDSDSLSFLLNQGSALVAPAWGKFWLSVLNVYEWEGNNPIPPELWYGIHSPCRPLQLLTFPILRVLPEWLPFHPRKWWMHCRMVYLPMGYLYGTRFQAKETDLILSLREVRLYENSFELH